MSWKVKATDRTDKRTGIKVGIRWEFRRYDPSSQRYERVPVAEIPVHIRSSEDKAEVDDFIRIKNAEGNALAARKKLRTSWVEKYPSMDKLTAEFESWRKIGSPNSWENECFYLRSYAMKFFLERCPSDDVNNVLNWHLFYESFREWLSKEKPLKVKKETLAKNTQNKVINSLNLFLAMVGKKVGETYAKCPMYGRDEVNEIRAEDLFSEDEYSAVRTALGVIRRESHDIFVVLRNTGMRINEALGLCQAFIVEGALEGQSLAKLHLNLQKYGLPEYFGYVCLESQLALDGGRAEKNYTDRFGRGWAIGSVPRKPLKCRRKIDPKWYRFIPIFDRDTWNILAARWNEQNELFAAKRWTDDQRDYLLFGELTAAMFYQDLVKACDRAGIRRRKPHILRHMFLTWFYSQTNEDRILAKKVGGHEDERTMQIYSHMAEQMGLDRKRQDQASKKMKLVL